MRIALVSQEYPPETGHGGIASQTYQKAHGLAARGHDVTVLSHSTDADRQDYVTGAVRVIRIPGYDEDLPIYTEITRWITYSALVASELASLNAEGTLDLVDFPEWGSEGYVHLLNRTEWNHIPAVVHLHGPLPMFAHAIGWPAVDSDLYRVGMHMEGTCLRLADAVFSSSRYSAGWCAEYHGLDAEKVEVLHMGVDTTQFRPLPVPRAEVPTVVFVGKIVRNKGVDVLLDAVLDVARDFPDMKLRMIGPGDEGLARSLEEKAIGSGFPQLLELTGYVARDDLPRHLCSAHVFAAPSVCEGGPGLVNLEAMACGLPVTVGGESGATEVVRDGDTGIVVPPGDASALAGAIRTLLGDEELRATMGARARRYVEEEAEAGQAVEKLEKLYERVIAGARAGAEDASTQTP